MEVKFGLKFQQHMVNFPKADRLKLTQFIVHIETQGFDGLQGRNKSSDNVPTNNPNWLAQVRYAQTHKLWHYLRTDKQSTALPVRKARAMPEVEGIPNYTQSANGDFTSEYVLHYILGTDFIVLVDLSPHPPFTLPDSSYLVY